MGNMEGTVRFYLKKTTPGLNIHALSDQGNISFFRDTFIERFHLYIKEIGTYIAGFSVIGTIPAILRIVSGENVLTIAVDNVQIESLPLFAIYQHFEPVI